MSPSVLSRLAVVGYWRKYVHEVPVNCLGGLSLPRKSVVRLTDRPDMTLDVYRGRKTTIQCNKSMSLKTRLMTLLNMALETLKMVSLIYFIVSEINIFTKFR